MSPQVTNVLEIVMVIIIVAIRTAGTSFIVWTLAASNISVGYKTILITIALIVGLGVSFKYQNPNAPCDPANCIVKENTK